MPLASHAPTPSATSSGTAVAAIDTPVRWRRVQRAARSTHGSRHAPTGPSSSHACTSADRSAAGEYRAAGCAIIAFSHTATSAGGRFARTPRIGRTLSALKPSPISAGSSDGRPASRW